jgi:acyl dehydratase
MSTLRKKAIEGLAAGDTFVVHRTFTEAEVQQFSIISKDYNPIHFDERFAGVKGFDGCICHGLLVASMLTEIGGQLGWLASGMNFRFKKPIYFKETISCRLTITDIDDRGRAGADAVYTNQEGDVVIEASLTGIVPGASERRILQLMAQEGDPTNRLTSENLDKSG